MTAGIASIVDSSMHQDQDGDSDLFDSGVIDERDFDNRCVSKWQPQGIDTVTFQIVRQANLKGRIHRCCRESLESCRPPRRRMRKSRYRAWCVVLISKRGEASLSLLANRGTMMGAGRARKIRITSGVAKPCSRQQRPLVLRKLRHQNPLRIDRPNSAPVRNAKSTSSSAVVELEIGPASCGFNTFIDHFVGSKEQRLLEQLSERLRCFKIQIQIQIGRLLHRLIGRIGAF